MGTVQLCNFNFRNLKSVSCEIQKSPILMTKKVIRISNLLAWITFCVQIVGVIVEVVPFSRGKQEKMKEEELSLPTKKDSMKNIR